MCKSSIVDRINKFVELILLMMTSTYHIFDNEVCSKKSQTNFLRDFFSFVTKIIIIHLSKIYKCDEKVKLVLNN